MHAAPVAARGRGGPRVATWFVSCDCGVFLTPHVSPSSRRHRGCDVACRVNACCRCRRTPHRAVPIDVDLTLKQSGSDFGAGDARWQGPRRTFKGAAIMTEDMVSEKAIVGVAMGRRGRTARTNCRGRAGKAPRKASRSARREPRRKNQRKCATDRFSPENLSFFLHRTEPTPSTHSVYHVRHLRQLRCFRAQGPGRRAGHRQAHRGQHQSRVPRQRQRPRGQVR